MDLVIHSSEFLVDIKEFLEYHFNVLTLTILTEISCGFRRSPRANSLLDAVEKIRNLTPAGNQIPAVQSVTRRCTDLTRKMLSKLRGSPRKKMAGVGSKGRALMV
jgi:hypothetical protein